VEIVKKKKLNLRGTKLHAPIRGATRGVHGTYVWFLPVDVGRDCVEEQVRLGLRVDVVNLDKTRSNGNDRGRGG